MSNKLQVERNNSTSAGTLPPDYNPFVAKSPQGILYCKTWWLNAVAPGRYEILIVRKGDTIKAAWPIVYQGDGKNMGIGMPFLTQKLGILFAPNTSKYAERLSEEHRLMQLLIPHVPTDIGFSQRFHENFTNWLPFYWEGFKQSTRYTYVIEDLDDVDAIWNNMRSHARQSIRKAMKNGIRAREIDDVELLYECNRKTFDRQGMQVPFSLETLARIDKACVTHAGRRMLVAEDASGRIHACDYLIYDENCAVSLTGGADPELRHSAAQALLDWESIQFSCTVSRRFDFEGSMIADIETYNRDFGARQLPFLHIWRRAVVKPHRQRFGSLRSIIGRVLLKGAKAVAPELRGLTRN